MWENKCKNQSISEKFDPATLNVFFFTPTWFRTKPELFGFGLCFSFKLLLKGPHRAWATDSKEPQTQTTPARTTPNLVPPWTTPARTTPARTTPNPPNTPEPRGTLFFTRRVAGPDPTRFSHIILSIYVWQGVVHLVSLQYSICIVRHEG